MIGNEELGRQAHRDCHERARQEYGDAVVTAGEPTTDWRASLLRHVFLQPLTVWRPAGEFEVILDHANRPVGFVDHAAWEGCEGGTVSGARLLGLVAEAGLGHPMLTVAERRTGPQGCLEAVLRPKFAGRWPTLRVRVNARRGSLIAVEPMSEDQEAI